MNTPQKTTAPGDRAPGGDRCNPSAKKGSTIMTQNDTQQATATNHGCGISWCINDRDLSPSQRFEHMSTGWYGSATADPISRSGSAYCETVMAVGVGLRFNADVDAAPYLYLHLHGGPYGVDADADLQLNEAILLHNAIGDHLRVALTGSTLDPEAVKEYYHLAVGGRRASDGKR